MPRPAITTFSSVEVKPTPTNNNNGLYAPQLTTAQRDAIPAATLRNGAMIYNITTDQFQSYVNNIWTNTGEGGDVVGPVLSVADNIATFSDNTGKLIQDSGVAINRVPALLLQNPFNLLPANLLVNEITDLGHIRFTNGTGFIFLESEISISFFLNTLPGSLGSQVCTLFTGGFPGSSTTSSALVELQSEDGTGALLLSRLTQAQIDVFPTPAAGMILFNKDTEKLSIYNGTAWEKITSNEFSYFFPPTYNNQLTTITQGDNQGGFGGGSVGTNKTMSTNTTAVFDTTAVNANSKGFQGAVFDGRYIYFVPYDNGTSGQVTRYDTTLPLNSAGSYSFFDTATVNANSKGFYGAVFDGRYIYFVPYFNGLALSGQITRYDTTLSFNSVGSYSVFDTTAVNTNSKGFHGAVFDGRYIYFVPAFSNNGQITRYDTTLSLNSAGSYSFFDTTTVNANSKGFHGAVFDGRYIYLVPYDNGPDFSGQVTRYDTTLPFTSAGSYSFFDTATVNANSKGFRGAVFDGKYVYLVPNTNNPSISGQVTRYDTTLPFTSAGSYSFFDTATVNANSKGFYGAVFDGKYIYFVPYDNGVIFGQVTRYDTTLPFTSGGSYSVFDTTTVDANSKGFCGAVFDGRYVYLVPNSSNGLGSVGQITRMDAYTGPSLDVGLYDALHDSVYPPTYNNQLATIAQGYNQGGFGGGSVGTNKTMSTNTTAVFDTATVNANSKGFIGAVFDGRYIYFVPAFSNNGQVTRYDTTSSFNLVGSYSVFDTTAVNANSKGFQGAVFDGRYIYFVPYDNATSGQVTRYDTTLSFTSVGSYSVFDTTAVNANSKGFRGAVFDGRYIYLVPNNNGVVFGQITRYDTTSSFNSAGSYSVFDTTAVNVNSKGFFGAVFDGKYVYLVPSTGQITRYDTTLPFTSVGSYSVFDTTAVNANSKGFFGAVFDGKYVYLAPYDNGTSGQVTKYDTTSSFTSAGSYSFFDTTAVNANSKGFHGAVFDGKYVYFVPFNNDSQFGQITRMDAYTGPSLDVGLYDALHDSVYPPTYNNQLATIAQGYNQGGFGGGSVGTNKTMSTNTTAVFDTTAVNANSKGFQGAVFDGRYIYFVPNSNNGTSGQITRYDTTLPLNSAGSYSFFDTATVNANSKGFYGAVFDGRYIYFVPYFNGLALSGQITRYDTTLSFNSVGSYSVFDTTAVNTNSKGFHGAVFDGKYVYLVPNLNGQVTRYDSTLPFNSVGSYSVFDTTTVDADSKGFQGAVFDGRYVYLVPYNNGNYSGQITRYDTTLPFNSVGSYSIFDTATVDANSKGFRGAVFDGKYIYLVPNTNNLSISGQVTRYDTTLPFNSGGSYSVFDTTTVNANSKGFYGAVFDGRYIYFVPVDNGVVFGQVTRYDTTLPFNSAGSYSVFDTTTVNANSKGFHGGIFDGKYVYLVPNSSNGLSSTGQITRIDAYTGPQVNIPNNRTDNLARACIYANTEALNFLNGIDTRVAIPTTTLLLNNFSTLGTNELQYIGSATAPVVQLTFNMSFSTSTTTPKRVTIFIYKNGAELIESKVSLYTTINNYYTLSTSTMLTVNYGDIFEIYLNLTATDSLFFGSTLFTAITV